MEGLVAEVPGAAAGAEPFILAALEFNLRKGGKRCVIQCVSLDNLNSHDGDCSALHGDGYLQ